jgi:hypothetical protein
MENLVEVKAISTEMSGYQEWTKVSRFLAHGLVGVVVREIGDEDGNED